MKIDSKDYHDYVIKDGALVREFEQMYQNSNEVPWHQDEQGNWLDVGLTVELLSREDRFGRIIDYGCGLGYYLNILSSGLKIKSNCFGFDISKTAVKRVAHQFPEYTFREADLTQMKNQRLVLPKDSNNSLHVVRATLWYIYPEIEVVVTNLMHQIESKDTLVIVQNFPPLDAEFVGKEVIPDHRALIKYFAAGGLRIDKYLWYEQYKHNSNDSWFIGIFRKGN